jgi:hypothetical protein
VNAVCWVVAAAAVAAAAAVVMVVVGEWCVSARQHRCPKHALTSVISTVQCSQLTKEMWSLVDGLALTAQQHVHAWRSEVSCSAL